LSERIFSVIEAQKKTAESENDQERKKILAQFTKEELGQAPMKKKKDPNAVNNTEHSSAISTHAKGRNDLWITHLHRMKEQAKAQAEAEADEEEEEEERQQSNKRAILDKLRNKALKQHNEKEMKKAKEQSEAAKGKEGEGNEEDEEWESDEEGEEDDEEEEYEEWEEEEEEEYEEYEFDEAEIEQEKEKFVQGILKKEAATIGKKEEEQIKLVKAKGPVDEITKGPVFEEIQQSKAPQVHFEDFPTLGTGEVMEFEQVDIPLPPKAGPKTEEEKIEEKAEEDIDLKRTIVQGDVKMQRFDDMGLPIDGYNYYQHVVDANSGGAPQFAYTVTYDHVVNLPEDNDFKQKKLNAEERDLYEALEYENEDGAYEDLDDDFFGALNQESNVKLEEGFFDPRQKQKKVTFVEGEVMEISTKKEEPGKTEPKKDEKGGKAKDSVLKNQEFNKVLDEHVALLKRRFKNERERNKVRYGIESSDEDEDVEEVEEFSDDEKEEEEDDSVREHLDPIPFEKDIAMQETMKRDLEDTEESESEDEEIDDRRSIKSTRTGQATEASAQVFSEARKAKLNIIKEQRTPYKRREKEAKKEEESEEEGEEEEDGEGKVEEVFKKREKGETKEERKARKEAVKQFKQERKEKKKKFKENFDKKKNEHLKINQRQATSLQGTTIYKMTV